MPVTTKSKKLGGLHGKMKSAGKSDKLSACACGSCGGLECLCRPRFFAGQLLTEEDLNRLDKYVRAKNRLHNLYLSGWGTVCGLEVLCDRCSGFVKVTSGYAIDPCGNDVILCADESVDVCKLIGECRQRKVHPCDPPKSNGQGGDDDLTERWLLYVESVEKAQRGITALRGASQAPCCDSCFQGRPCECGCAGHGGCGCRCAEKSNGHTHGNGKSTLRPPPPQCEPTVICESHRFGACRLPDIESNDDVSLGPLLDRMIECITEMLTALYDGAEAATEADIERARRIWQRFLDEHPGTLCELRMPEISDDSSINYYLAILAYLLECFCHAWIPPCPDVACDGRVPLAEVTVTAGKCKVVRICNLTRHRRFVRTPPNVAYWLSPFQIVRAVRWLLEWICCEGLDFDGLGYFGGARLRTGAAVADSHSGSTPPSGEERGTSGQRGTRENASARIKSVPGRNTVKRRMEEMFEVLTKSSSGLDLTDLYRSLSGARDDNGVPTGSVKNVSDLPMAMMLRAIALPLWEQVAPRQIAELPGLLKTLLGGDLFAGTVGVTRPTVGAAKSTDEAPAAADVAALRSEFAELKTEVKKLRDRKKS